MTSSSRESPLKLLALDGGGIRGLSELLILKDLMHKVMVQKNAKRRKNGQPLLVFLPKPCDLFDLIGGTGTGGIVALMLGRLRMDVDTAINHYNNLAKHVFSHPKRWQGDGKFKATKLEEAMKVVIRDATGDSESLLLEHDVGTCCRTFVCAMNAYNMDANIPVIFRSYESLEPHSNCKIWEAARATSAMPAFFKHIEIGRAQPYIDGGLGRNNPSRVVLDEAKRLFGARHIGCLVSIGTGHAETISIKKSGGFGQIVPTDIFDTLKAITSDCEATHQAMLGLFSNLPATYFRLNVDQGMQGIDFSKWERLSNVEAHTTQYLRRAEVIDKVVSLVNVIETTKPQLTIEQLVCPRPPLEPVLDIRVRKLCPPPVASFIGRKDILDKMRSYFDSDGAGQHIFVLYGLGGAGKSQLAFKFIEESKGKRFSEIFYVDATSEQTLQTDLKAISPGNAKQTVDGNLRWLASRTDGNWLLYFDNADDVNLRLNKFLPQCASGHILVTTRNRELRQYAATEDANVNVTGMDADDAVNLLLRKARAGRNEGNLMLAKAIVQDLHYFALAVAQAGAFIHCCPLSLCEYRELYQRERNNLLQNEETQGQDPYELAVYSTWRLSYEKLEGPARSLLQICSFLHHDGISEDMFKKAALSRRRLYDLDLQNKVTKLLNQLGKQDSGWSSWTFKQITRHLGSYSLIEYDTQNRTYSIHPLVHHWSGTTTEGNQRDMQKLVLTIIGLSISWTFAKEDYRYRCTLLKHAINSTALLEPEDIDAEVGAHIAQMYFEAGHLKETEALEVMVMKKRKQVLGDDHLDTLASMEGLANTYRAHGYWEAAEALVVAVLEKRKRVLGDDHPDTLMSMAILAATYYSQGRWKEAEAHEVVVLEKRKQVLGDSHLETLRSMADLANTYCSQGRLKDAEALHVVALEKMKQVRGEDHPDTLLAMANLAATYRCQGRWKEAEVLEVGVLERRKQVLGDDHPDTLTSMANLANTYRSQGRWNDAEALEVVVLERRKQILRDDHPDTLTVMANLANTYKRQGRWKDTEALEKAVLEKSKRVLGDDHPDTLMTMGNLAVAYLNQGRLNDAGVLQVVVLEKRKQVLGDDHLDTLTAMANLANTYKSQGRLDHAEALQVVVLEKRKHVLGDDHPDTLTATANLATTYRRQGRLKEAEVLQLLVLEKKKRVLGDDHPDTITSMAFLAVVYSSQGRFEDAEALEVEVLEKRRWVLGDDHPDTITSMARLAVVYFKQGRLDDEEALEVMVLEKRRRVLGDDHPDTLTAMKSLARTYRRQGRMCDAEALEGVLINNRK